VQPVYVLNEKREIVYFNAACNDWLTANGVADVAMLVGVRCDYQSGDEDPAIDLASRLCPPAEVFSGIKRSGTIQLASHENSNAEIDRCAPETWRIEFVPLPDEIEDCCGVIAFVSTETRNTADSVVASDTLDDVASKATNLHQQLRQLRDRWGSQWFLDVLIGDSPASLRIRRQAQAASQSDAPVLLLGPPGSRLRLFARSIFYAREDAGLLMPVACALLDPESLQVTLRKISTNEHNRNAQSLLFERVDLMPRAVQQELTGFLSLPRFTPTILATSEQSLLRMAEQGDFDSNLAELLSVTVIESPPLSKRREAIPLLAQLYLEQHNSAGGRQLSGLSEEALDLLAGYDWPENLKELANAINDACEKTEGPEIQASDLPDILHVARDARNHPRKETSQVDLDALLSEIEEQLMQRALEQAGGNKSQAAKLLGITRARLLRKLK